MLKIPKEVDYGVLILLCLFEGEEGEVLSAQEIARRRTLPPQQVAKLLKLFQRANIVSSTRGPKGGYTLRTPGESLDLKTIYRVIEGPLSLAECMGSHPSNDCRIQDGCSFKPHLVLLDKAIRDAFSKITIAKISGDQEIRTPFVIGAGV